LKIQQLKAFDETEVAIYREKTVEGQKLGPCIVEDLRSRATCSQVLQLRLARQDSTMEQMGLQEVWKPSGFSVETYQDLQSLCRSGSVFLNQLCRQLVETSPWVHVYVETIH